MLKSKIVRLLLVLAVVGVAWGAKKYLGIELPIDGASNGGSTAVATPERSTSGAPREAARSSSDRGGGTAAVARDLGTEELEAVSTRGDAAIADLVRRQRSGVMVELAGTVRKSLPDDNDGARHQRFIVRLASGDTVLVAHNIDLAPRVPLDEGDLVHLKGQYEWNEQGGVVHWTHHDPAGRHDEGWIRHDGREYD